MYFGDYSETKARYLITKYGGTSLNEWMMTNQFYDILLSNGFYTDLEAYKADPANRPLIDEKPENGSRSRIFRNYFKI